MNAADPQQWREAYDAKVQDLARETARLSGLVRALLDEGHRPDPMPRHAHCRLCQALKSALGANPPEAVNAP